MARPIAYTKKVNRGAKIVSYLEDKSTVEVILYVAPVLSPEGCADTPNISSSSSCSFKLISTISAFNSL